jgi:antitoxin MazE
MRANLVKVGNSKGIIIPSALLNTCELKDAVELQVKGKTLVIAALKEPRAGWFDTYVPEKDEADLLAGIPLDEDTDEWQW